MPGRHFILFAALAGLSVAAYVGLSALGGHVGFPLDDAWIHQTYARNLAESGLLAYVPGQPSAGSTSPLWTLLVAAGYRLNVDYRLWTYALGAGSLALCAWMLTRLSLRLWPDRPRLAYALGLLCVFEWHLAWAASSGMETVLFAALGLALMERAARSDSRRRGGLIFGALGGLLTLTRPEGLLLIALAGLVVLARAASLARVGFAFTAAASFTALIAPVALLNLQAGGTLFPNTFYAKQQEYAIYFTSLSTWLPRAFDVIGAPFVGAQVLLVPGFLLEAFWSLRRLPDRSPWARLLPVVWMGAHLAVYLARLPVTYQHGRYLIPIVPALLLIGLHGSVQLLGRLAQPGVNKLAILSTTEARSFFSVRSESLWLNLAVGSRLRRVGVGSLAAIAAAFWIIGAGAYRVDVNIIENELVASAHWIEANTPPGALVAAHDIGAIGYFTRRPLLDLAGLISPQVIPIIRDEPALLALLRSRRADFLAAPPDFYATLLEAPELERAFAGNSPFAPKHWLVFRVVWGQP